MTQELIYTSAPQGLRPGSRGFCTVVSTQGMAVNLADRLESLSAYRHVFAPQDPNAGLNPVVYSHIRMTVGGRPFHVLSRVAAAGLDYTQRTNKFAHHVVLDVAELAPAGPSWLLSQPGFMQSQWDGQPKVLPVGRRAARRNARTSGLPELAIGYGRCRVGGRACGIGRRGNKVRSYRDLRTRSGNAPAHHRSARSIAAAATLGSIVQYLLHQAAARH